MKTVAIIIGVSEYQDNHLETLPGASADAARFASALMSWGLPKSDIHFFLNENATKANIIKSFYDCRSFFDRDARLIFYFAGHGIREKYHDQTLIESFLLSSDSYLEDLSTGLRLVELMQLLRSLKPTQAFLFIDACSLRLNHIENPLNEENLFSTANSKGLFCLFSSGIEKSYEDETYQCGYFTNALLKVLAELRIKKEATCHDIAERVTSMLKIEDLPPPEIYHIGLENMWPLDDFSTKHVQEKKRELIFRWEAIGQLQDRLVSTLSPIIWMWGEGGIGKSVIAEQFCKTNSRTILASIPSGASLISAVFQSLIEQVRLQKAELFFNRPPETSLTPLLKFIETHQPGCVLIIDQLDRLTTSDLKLLLSEIDQVHLPSILISRYLCPFESFSERRSNIIEWQTIHLSFEEIEEMIAQRNLDPSLASMLLNACHGNPFKIRQMLVKLSGEEISLSSDATEKYIRSSAAIVATGGFLDEHLFCHTFELDPKALANLEKLGFIRYTANGCFPHDLLIEMVEEQEWGLDLDKACLYWKNQIQSTPYNRWACRSLTLLASQIEDCSLLHEALDQCLETLNERETLHFLIDLIAIFERQGWENSLIKSSDYLIDHEEYHLAGRVLAPLLNSSKTSIKNHAIKNETRRLVWLGQFAESIQANIEVLKTCRKPEILVPLKNNIGIAHFFSGNLDMAIQLFQENLDYKGKKDEREMGIAQLMIGLIQTYRGEDVYLAKQFLEKSLQIFETTRYYLWNIVSLNSLGDLFYRLGQWRQALYYLEKAEDIAETLQNKTFHLFTLKNKTRVYLRLFGFESQELSIVVDRLELVYKQVLEIGHNWVTVWAANALSTVYAHRKEVEKLERMIKSIAPLTEHYKECHIFTLSNLGHLSALKEDFEKAEEEYNQAFLLTKELNNPFALDEIQQDFLGCDLPNFLWPTHKSESLLPACSPS